MYNVDARKFRYLELQSRISVLQKRLAQNAVDSVSEARYDQA